MKELPLSDSPKSGSPFQMNHTKPKDTNSPFNLLAEPLGRGNPKLNSPVNFGAPLVSGTPWVAGTPLDPKLWVPETTQHYSETTQKRLCQPQKLLFIQSSKIDVL